LYFLIYTIGIIAIIYSIPSVNHIGKTLFAGAGIFASILGFASQQAFSNGIETYRYQVKLSAGIKGRHFQTTFNLSDRSKM
jgi:hypothetical protein|tara:strand:+ start:795 stop:1037 length:243 start_codon:yes stop_codon:yes gene_type:complete